MSCICPLSCCYSMPDKLASMETLHLVLMCLCLESYLIFCAYAIKSGIWGNLGESVYKDTQKLPQSDSRTTTCLLHGVKEAFPGVPCFVGPASVFVYISIAVQHLCIQVQSDHKVITRTVRGKKKKSFWHESVHRERRERPRSSHQLHPLHIIDLAGPRRRFEYGTSLFIYSRTSARESLNYLSLSSARSGGTVDLVKQPERGSWYMQIPALDRSCHKRATNPQYLAGLHQEP